MKKEVFLPLFLIVLGAIFFATLLVAYNNGVGDQDMPTSSGSCSDGIGCHGSLFPDVKLVITSQADDGTWDTPGESGAVACTVNIDAANSDANIAGVMLLNASGANIKDDGWTITLDPDSNSTPFNYNERVCSSGDYVYSWRVNAPSTPGSYQMKARMQFDNSGPSHDTSYVLSFNFTVGISGKKNLVMVNSPQLFYNKPNPFSMRTDIRYAVPREGKVVLTVYDLTGRVVRKLVNTVEKPGYYTVRWDGRDSSGRRVANGIYFYRLDAGGFTATKKLMFTK